MPKLPEGPREEQAMAATAKTKTKGKPNLLNLRVIRGGKNGSTKSKKKAAPKKAVKKKTAPPKKKVAAEKPKRGRGRPPENKAIWKSVLRLPKKQADRLKKAVKGINKERAADDQLSINKTIGIIIDVYLEEEGY